MQNGKITLKVCKDGEIADMIVTKKDKEMYKSAKKKECGDYI
jgi:ribosomal protein RSM22 (predicted rRNA methylase)